MKNTKFKKWIMAQGGAKAVARLINSESPRVKAWLASKASPKVTTMQQLVKLGKGAFTYDDIITETKNIS